MTSENAPTRGVFISTENSRSNIYATGTDMNIEINPETLAQINKQLAAEAEAKPENPIEKALESAEDIRANIKAIKGEAYLNAVNFGVNVHKIVGLNASVCSMLVDANKDAKVPVMIIGRVFSHMMAGMLNDYCDALQLNNHTKEFAEELTGWVDRVREAEDAGVEGLINKLEKGNED